MMLRCRSVPWDKDHFTIGLGVNALSGEPLARAFPDSSSSRVVLSLISAQRMVTAKLIFPSFIGQRTTRKFSGLLLTCMVGRTLRAGG